MRKTETEFAPGVTCRYEDDGVRVLSGKKDALIAAGLCSPDEFPKGVSWRAQSERVWVWRCQKRGVGCYFEIRGANEMLRYLHKLSCTTFAGRVSIAGSDPAFQRFMAEVLAKGRAAR